MPQPVFDREKLVALLELVEILFGENWQETEIHVMALLFVLVSRNPEESIFGEMVNQVQTTIDAITESQSETRH
jgi:hypothetical protein